MNTIRKLLGKKEDVFIMMPTGWLAQPFTDKTKWLIEHMVEFGYRDGREVGVYLSDIDAIAFKLKYGL